MLPPMTTRICRIVAVWMLAWGTMRPAIAEGQGNAARPAFSPPRTAAGKPDMNGVWQALNSASWDIEDHSGQLGVPPGLGVVEGGPIPYLPAAAAKKRENYAKRAAAVQQEISSTISFPGETLILSAEGKNYAFGRKFRRMKGSRLL